MTAALSSALVDVTKPGTGPFAVIEFGHRDITGVGSFGVVRSDDPGRWPWFTATKREWCTAVCAALNATVKQ